MRAGFVGWAVAVLACVLLWFSVQHGVALTAERDDAQAALAKAERQVKTLRANVSTVSRDAQVARQELQDALRKAPEWAGTPVPDPIVDSLCQHIRCVKPGTVRTPSR